MKQQKGFTLVELIFVVAIVGILVAFAFPAYQRYVDNGRRTDGQAALLQLASHMERRFTENNSYCDSGSVAVVNCGAANGDTGEPAFFDGQVPMDGGDAYYLLRITAVGDATFEIQAQATGVMANDDCGDFVLSHVGLKTQANNAEVCW